MNELKWMRGGPWWDSRPGPTSGDVNRMDERPTCTYGGLGFRVVYDSAANRGETPWMDAEGAERAPTFRVCTAPLSSEGSGALGDAELGTPTFDSTLPWRRTLR